MTRWWADTLFKRLFLLMWAALVISHLCAFLVVRSLSDMPAPPSDGFGPLPVMPSLPPGGLVPDVHADHGPGGPGGPGGHGPRQRDGLPASALWLDYGVRFLVIGAAAWIGARWLASPMRRLSRASALLGNSLAERAPPAALDEARGTREVRQTAQVFNAMATQLQAQFEAQTLLMAAISHDLRTPLARLRLRLEPMPQAEACIAEVRAMDAMIGSVLEMMRGQHAATPKQRLDLRALVLALTDDLAELDDGVDAAGIDRDGPPIIVSAPREALQRVLGNLIGNAVHHGGSACVNLAVAHDERCVKIHIDDHGPGLPAHELDAVFRPFYRAAPADGAAASGTAPAAQGTGLGLYIARDLTQRLGGRLTLANRAEGGLRAELVVPLA